MEKNFTILIADRNSHVRDFIRREMIEEGCEIKLAENCQEVIKWVYHPESVDLLILDPDLPNIDNLMLKKILNDRIPVLPVVVHSFSSVYPDFLDMYSDIYFVEKSGNSIEALKYVVSKIRKEK